MTDASTDAAFAEKEQQLFAASSGAELIELYLARIDAGAKGREKAGLLCKIAHVFDKLLDDPNQAFDALLLALELELDNAIIDQELSKLAHRTERWKELADTVNRWLLAEQDTRRKIALCLLLGRWYSAELGRPEYSVPYFQQVHKLDPNNVKVLRVMAGLVADVGDLATQGKLLVDARNNSTDEAERAELEAEIDDILRRLNG